MKEFNFYSIIGVAVPGAFAIFGMSFLIPQLQSVFLSEDMGLGNLGVFLMISYVAGQFVQAFGNLLEWIWWKSWKGMPSDWPRSGEHRLLSNQQNELLGAAVVSLLSPRPDVPIVSMDAKSWFAITRQVYASVARAGKAERVDKFNANYGLNRGMAASVTMVAVAILVVDGKTHYGWALLALSGSLVFLFRMHRFAKHYAMELYVQFLQVPLASPDDVGGQQRPTSISE